MLTRSGNLDDHSHTCTLSQYKCKDDDDADAVYNYHPDTWLWNCYDGVCTDTLGTLVFEDPLPEYTESGGSATLLS